VNAVAPAVGAGEAPVAAADEMLRLREQASRVMDHPSGFLAFSPRNRFFTLDAQPGFIAYREGGRHCVAFGGVHAPPESRAVLLDAFLEMARARRRRVMAVQLRGNQAPLFASRGFTVNPLGSSFAITLRGFTLAGTKKMKLRNKIKRAKGEGLIVQELGRELPRNEASFERLREISALWLKAKGKKELEFMIGELGGVGDSERRVFLVSDAQGLGQAFITYVPAWGERPGVLHDLTRKRPDAPVGALELCNAFALERFVAEGIPHLHFGFTPFIVEPKPPDGASRLLHWFVLQLRRRGQFIYPADTQASYKLKWGTDVVEQEFVAARPLSLRSVVDLLLLTRAV
jgi:lysylphosphatidylglycerol synthetase-like protein (DUF2156 family)